MLAYFAICFCNILLYIVDPIPTTRIPDDKKIPVYILLLFFMFFPIINILFLITNIIHLVEE